MTSKKSRYSTKENRIPIGKKRVNLEKINVIKNQELEIIVDQGLKRKANKTSKKNESKSLKLINLNMAPTDTSLMKPIDKPRVKLSTIREIKELEEKASNTIVRSNDIKTVSDMPSSNQIKLYSKKESTVLVRKLQGETDVENLNNTMDQIAKPSIPEIVISPFVCMTRGQKWKPSPTKPPKLSELYNKYEINNVADMYRKKLDEKTVELHNNVAYWTKLSTENGSNIPESVKDEIDVVCGQTKLLTTDKFMQMRSLIEEYDNNSGTMPINTDDLDGFWDMLLLQVKKLEGQFNELAILKNNKWIPPIQPVVKKVINRVSKVKRPIGKSTFTASLKYKNKKPDNKNINNYNPKDDSNRSKFYEMKLSNNNCLISSTPTSSNHKPISFTPMLLKTMELSYVARRSGMTPLILGENLVSPLKPALKNPVIEKAAKPKNIQFKTPETTTVDDFVTPENSNKDHYVSQKKSVQNRVVTPHATKVSKLNQNDLVETQTNSVKINNSGNHKNIRNKKLKESTIIENDLRRSERLAKKPTKNYKC